ncbi:hypothetical protein J4Q44_G00103970 [Coregonus suidteri]|uniref:Uncharacterized protein n=1 Tax=Coregonus suidteri TaxID=861788 RepID=A0AAN8MRI4_9TELE
MNTDGSGIDAKLMRPALAWGLCSQSSSSNGALGQWRLDQVWAGHGLLQLPAGLQVTLPASWPQGKGTVED